MKQIVGNLKCAREKEGEFKEQLWWTHGALSVWIFLSWQSRSCSSLFWEVSFQKYFLACPVSPNLESPIIIIYDPLYLLQYSRPLYLMVHKPFELGFLHPDLSVNGLLCIMPPLRVSPLSCNWSFINEKLKDKQKLWKVWDVGYFL